MCEVDVESGGRIIRVGDASYEMIEAVEVGLSYRPIQGSEFVMKTLKPRQRGALSGILISTGTVGLG